MIVILVAAVAEAQDAIPCEPFTAADFRALVVKDQAALKKDDLITHGAVYQEIVRRSVCLKEPVPPDAWADELVDDAVVDFALGKKWELPLATALAINPGVRHDFGPAPVRTWTAPDAPPAGVVSLVGPSTYYLDGVRITSVTSGPLPGVHLVQSTSVQGAWTTFVLEDQPYPVLTEEPVAPQRPDGLATAIEVGLAAGYGHSGQQVADAGNFLGDAAAGSLSVALQADALIRVSGPFGVAVDGTAGLQLGSSVDGDVWVGPALALPFGAISLGGGVMTARAETAEGASAVIVPQPNLAFTYGGPSGPLRLMVDGGWTVPAAHADLHAGLALGKGKTHVVPGLSVGWAATRLVQPSSGREIHTSRLTAGVRVGIVWG